VVTAGLIARDLPRPDAAASRDREAYFVAAYSLLSEGGCDAVTVAALCERLGVTKGSFYHHFADLPAFVEAFAARWRQSMVERLQAYGAMSDPWQCLQRMQNDFHELVMSGAEPAIRGWARTNPAIAAALATMHDVGEPPTFAQLARMLGDEELGHLIARMGTSVTVGLQLRIDEIDPDRYLLITVEELRRVGVEAEVVRVDGRLQSRVHRAPCLEYPIDTAWAKPTIPPEWTPRRPGTPAPVAVGKAARGTEAFLACADSLLFAHGHESLTAGALCERLWVSKGSFYHHFGNMTVFVDRLTEQWETTHLARLEAVRSEPDPLLRLARLLQPLLDERDTSETAWRAWAHADPAIGNVLRRIDNHHQGLVTDTITAITADPLSDVLGEATVALSIGLQQPRPAYQPHERAWAVLEWARRILRVPAELRLDRDQLVIALGKPS
jgi:AcrR family transcriptional regulator